MLKRLLFIGVGFAVGYLIDTLRRQQAGEFADDVPAATMEEIYVTPAKPKKAEPKPVTAEKPVVENADFLKEINGIGPTYAKRLFDGGIHSLQALVDAGADQVAQIAKLRSRSQAEDWISQAAQLLAK